MHALFNNLAEITLLRLGRIPLIFSTLSIVTRFNKSQEKPPINPILKFAKFLDVLGYLAHIERQFVFRIETLCNHMLDVFV